MHRFRLKSVDATTAPRIILLAGIFLSPSFFDLGSVKPFDISKVAVLWFFGWLAFAVTVIEAIRGEIRLTRFRLALPAGLFLVATAVSTLFSRTRAVSFFGWYGRYNGFVEILLYVVIFWLIVQLYWARPERLKEIFVAIAAASIALSGYVIIQWLGLDPIRWVQPSGRRVFRYFGSMGNSNFAGGYLGATVGWLAFAFWRARRLAVRLAVVAGGFATLFALWQTSSRDGLVGAFVSGCVALYVFRRRLPRVLTVTAAVGAVVAVVGVTAWAIRSHDETPTPALSRRGQPSLVRTGTFVVRIYWWRSALRIFADRPLVGAGPDTFVTQYPRYAVPGSASVRGTERTDEPHNIFLERASSLGILGLGSYLAVLFFAFRWGMRRLRQADELETDLLGSFLIVAAGYLGQGFFSIDVAALAAIGWIALGGIAALADPRVVAARARAGVAGDDRDPPPIRAGRRIAAFVAMVLLAGVVVSGLRPWLADRAAKQAQRDAGDTASTELVLSSYRRAMALAPYDPVYRALAANFLVQQASHVEDKDVRTDLLTQAVAYQKEMDSLHPGNPFWKMNIGAGLTAVGVASADVAHFEEAEIYFADAEKLAPYDRRVPLQYGMMLNRWGAATRDGLKYCQAIASFNRANGLRRDPEAYKGLGQALAATGHVDEALAALEQAREIGPSSPQAEPDEQLPKMIERTKRLKARKIKVIECD